ncbi:MAG: hypothetical protein WCF23_00025 [Candidatus Nitrosopolaris sp.]
MVGIETTISYLIMLGLASAQSILTAETIDLIFYRHSLFISIPLSLLAGAFAIVVPEAYRRTKNLSSSAYVNSSDQ